MIVSLSHSGPIARGRGTTPRSDNEPPTSKKLPDLAIHPLTGSNKTRRGEIDDCAPKPGRRRMAKRCRRELRACPDFADTFDRSEAEMLIRWAGRSTSGKWEATAAAPGRVAPIELGSRRGCSSVALLHDGLGPPGPPRRSGAASNPMFTGHRVVEQELDPISVRIPNRERRASRRSLFGVPTGICLGSFRRRRPHGGHAPGGVARRSGSLLSAPD